MIAADAVFKVMRVNLNIIRITLQHIHHIQPGAAVVRLAAINDEGVVEQITLAHKRVIRIGFRHAELAFHLNIIELVLPGIKEPPRRGKGGGGGGNRRGGGGCGGRGGGGVIRVQQHDAYAAAGVVNQIIAAVS